MSRKNRYDLLDLINDVIKCPNSEVTKQIPNSWKFTRAINRQTYNNTCEKTAVPFPEHWDMKKW